TRWPRPRPRRSRRGHRATPLSGTQLACSMTAAPRVVARGEPATARACPDSSSLLTKTEALMSQTPPPQYGQFMPNGRPRPGAPGSAPSSPPPPRYVDYGNPRAYDTSVRPTSGLTAARFAPAQIQRPDRAQPQSAWATQTRRVQEVSQVAASRPTVNIGVWLAVVALGISLILVLGFFFLMFVIEASASPAWWPIAAFCAVPSL